MDIPAGISVPGRVMRRGRREEANPAERRAARLRQIFVWVRPLQEMAAWKRYFLAMEVVSIAFAICYLFSEVFPYPFLLFFPAVLLVTFTLDRRTGYFSAVLSAILVWYFFVPVPVTMLDKHPSAIISVALFLLISCLSSRFIEAVRVTVYELIESLGALRDSYARMDDFVHIVSHDLKEPIRAINNFASFFLEDYGPKVGGDGREMLQVLKGQASRLDDLVSELLKYAVIGRRDRFEKINSRDLVADVLKSMELRLREENVTVTLEEQLPDIVCNRVYVGEVFRNLITNAIKYNDKAEKIIEIKTCKSIKAPEGAVVFCVKDNGIGIPDKHRDDIFKMFRRLHTRGQFGGGTGSGLAIVKKIIEEHKGRIWVESEPGKGSEFYFFLGVPSGLT